MIMKRIFGLFSGIFLCLMVSAQGQSDFVPLKELFKNDFLIGAAVSSRDFTGEVAKKVVENYNTITSENSMKPENLLARPPRPVTQQTQAGQGGQTPPRMPGFNQGPVVLDTINGLVFNWAEADRIANFARENNLIIRGHTLVWHSQTPATFFTAENGTQLTKEQLYEKMKIYMTAVINRYKDVVFCWDVVNEALSDSEGNVYRTESKWYEICGKDFIAQAFRTARSINPDVKLFYNDYNIVDPAKLERACILLKELVDAGVPIDGVGLQAHWSNDITAEMLQNAIDRFSALGLEIHITELDVTTYTAYHGEGAKNQVQETHQYTDEIANVLAESYKRFFEVLHKNADKITSVTFWGLDDSRSWLNNFPVRGRRDYPLLFDNQGNPKKAYYSVKSVYNR
jgi:GH35 family endo-1,4-beta-xylanase